MPEQPYEKWHILNVRRKKDREILQAIISPVGEESTAAQSVLDYVMHPPKSKKLSLCQTVLVEHGYFDQDYIDSVSTFYSKMFKGVERLCTRLHFFSTKLKNSDVAGFRALERLQDYYLGFSIKRPLETKILGRSAIRPRRDEPETEFHTCKADMPVNVAGSTLFAKAAPYMEQDSRVQTCSSVAIWVSTTIIAHALDYPKYTTSQIMDYATRDITGTRVGPTEGLTYEQMMHALKIMGYEPIIFDETDPFEALYEVYCYIESELPPILLLTLPNGTYHAITALGHGHKRPLRRATHITVESQGSTTLKYFRSSEWVPFFYVHDDQRGIYRRLKFLRANPARLRQKINALHKNVGLSPEISVDLKQWHCPISIETNSTLGNTPKESIANLWGVIVPLPKGVTLNHTEAEGKAVGIIPRCAARCGLELPDDLVLRCYLTPSNRYKSALGQRDDMGSFVRIFYQGKPMPKYLWVIEMSTAKLMNTARLDELRVRGELLLDASSNPWPTDFVAFHWVDDENKGHLLTMSQDDISIEEALSDVWHGPDVPYGPMVR
ncbi:MAG: hypothetical protein ACOC6S_01735 [Chloroflexota bacterium]